MQPDTASYQLTCLAKAWQPASDTNEAPDALVEYHVGVFATTPSDNERMRALAAWNDLMHDQDVEAAQHASRLEKIGHRTAILSGPAPVIGSILRHLALDGSADLQAIDAALADFGLPKGWAIEKESLLWAPRPYYGPSVAAVTKSLRLENDEIEVRQAYQDRRRKGHGIGMG